MAQKSSWELSPLLNLIQCFLQSTLPFSHVTLSVPESGSPSLPRSFDSAFSPHILPVTGPFPFFRPWHEHPLVGAALSDHMTAMASTRCSSPSPHPNPPFQSFPSVFICLLTVSPRPVKIEIHEDKDFADVLENITYHIK